MPARAVFALIVSLCSLGCGEPVTQLVAVIDTDLDTPDPVARLRVRSLRADADVEEELSSELIPIDGATTFPITVAVEPFDAMDVGRVIIEAEAQGQTGLRVVAQRATTEFRVGEQLAVPFDLLDGCRRVNCPPSDTCGPMGCRSQEVDAGSLSPFEGELDAP